MTFPRALKILACLFISASGFNAVLATSYLRPLIYDGGRITIGMIGQGACTWLDPQTRWLSCLLQVPSLSYLHFYSDPAPLTAAWIYFATVYIFIFATFLWVLFFWARQTHDILLVLGIWVLAIHPGTVFLINTAIETATWGLVVYLLFQKLERGEQDLRKRVYFASAAAFLAFGHQSAVFIFGLLGVWSLAIKDRFRAAIMFLGVVITVSRIIYAGIYDPIALGSTFSSLMKCLREAVVFTESPGSQVFWVFGALSLVLFNRNTRLTAVLLVVVLFLLWPHGISKTFFHRDAYSYRTLVIPFSLGLFLIHALHGRFRLNFKPGQFLMAFAVLFAFFFQNLIADYRNAMAFLPANDFTLNLLEKAESSCQQFDLLSGHPADLYRESLPFAALLLKNSFEVDRLIFARNNPPTSIQEFHPCSKLNPHTIYFGYDRVRGYWGVDLKGTSSQSRFHLKFLDNQKTNEGS